MTSSQKMTVVCLGDSTTAGTPGFFSPRERPPEGQGNPESQYAHWISQRHPDWEVLNRGVRGQRTDQMLRRFNWDVPPHQPDLVIILGGVNDIHQGKEMAVIQDQLSQLYERALAESPRVLACSILPLNILEPELKEKVTAMNHWIRETSHQKKIGFCDTYKVLEDPERPGFLTGTPDEIHPDVAGYKRMGFAIADQIKSLWPEMVSGR